jgi:hypothetical protein
MWFQYEPEFNEQEDGNIRDEVDEFSYYKSYERAACVRG